DRLRRLVPVEVREQAIRIRHLRHALRIDERAELYRIDSRREQRLDPRDLQLRRHDRRLDLQPVARADLVNRDPGRAHTMTPTRAAIASAISSVVCDPPMS